MSRIATQDYLKCRASCFHTKRLKCVLILHINNIFLNEWVFGTQKVLMEFKLLSCLSFGIPKKNQTWSHHGDVFECSLSWFEIYRNNNCCTKGPKAWLMLCPVVVSVKSRFPAVVTLFYPRVAFQTKRDESLLPRLLQELRKQKCDRARCVHYFHSRSNQRRKKSCDDTTAGGKYTGGSETEPAEIWQKKKS